ncbi:MAG: GMC family oxidoreductase [Acidimicrobiia bacterium]
MSATYDVVIIGSGFGGSVSALRLTEKGYRVGVLEAGRRYRTGEFATTNWNLKRFLWGPRLGLYGIQRIDLLANVLVLSGAGVGGGSLVYANTSYEPHDAFYTDPQWGKITDWKQELAPFYATAKRMLGVEEASADTPADDVMRTIAQRLGVEDTFRPTPVAVYLGEPGVETDDPYFGGAGPRRSGCTLVGACMIGCNNNAKNTLDKNYLYLAEQAGAAVHADAEVIDLEPMRDGGWRLTTQQPGPRSGRNRQVFFAHQVIFSAGALGTTRLLLKLIDAGRLGNISEQAGQLVRTNSEVLLGATAHSTDVDYSQGVAITSSVHPEPHTHIEPVRYPRGSSLMGLLATVLTDGGPGLPRPLRYLVNVLTHPVRWVRSMSLRRWAERSVILLVMQSYDNSLRLIRKRGIFGTRIVSRQGHGEPNPTYIPVANEAARIAAEAMGGDAMSSINEVLLNRPTTAHILGGAAIGSDPSSGVIDAYHRVFGHPGLHVVDGAAVGANLGVNPSLSITAMSERAMAMWPNKGEADPRPPLGSEYRVVGPVRPNDPVVDPSVLGIDPWSSASLT